MVIVILIAAIIGGGVASDDGDDDAVAGGSAETYVAKALVYAGDNSIGYCYDFPSPAHCRNHNPDMDCSSFIWYSLVDSGYVSKDNLPGPFSTHSMPEALAAIGFTDVTSKVNLSTGQGLQRGDILINRANHTELYIGNGKNVGAHQDKDGRPGDSSGLEVCTNDYYNFPWTHVMRPPVGSDLDGIHASPEKAKEIAKSVIAKEYPQWNNGTQWEALEWIWTKESGWRYNAENPSSGAYGIPQAFMKELILTLMDHKGLVRALIGLAIFFVVASVGVFAVRTFGTTSPHEEIKKEKKSDDIKLSKEDKETIDDYTNDTKQLVALLQSNSWIATTGEKSIDFGDNTITVIDPGSSKSNSKPKSFVIQSMTQETEDGTGNEIYNCSIEINGKSHLLMVTKPKSSSDITVAINLSDTGLQCMKSSTASSNKSVAHRACPM